MGLPGADALARSQFTGDAVRVTVSTASALSTALPLGGTYLLYSDVACRIKQVGSAGTVTTSTGTPLPAGTFFGPIYCDAAANQYVAVISSGTGTLDIIPVT